MLSELDRRGSCLVVDVKIAANDGLFEVCAKDPMFLQTKFKFPANYNTLESKKYSLSWVFIHAEGTAIRSITRTLTYP